MSLSRRSFVSLSSGLSALGISAFATRAWAQPVAAPYAIAGADAFPQQDPSLVKDAVGASHGNFARVRELVEKQPAMACASIDWGFGDWETCLDAAAHVGNKPIADFLLQHGARPTIFSAAMMGQLDAVKAFDRGASRHSEDARTARHHPDVARQGRRSGRRSESSSISRLSAMRTRRLRHSRSRAADRDALLGKYVYGPGPRDYFTVDVQQDRLGIDRPNSPARRFLMHTGNLVFFPTGVPTAKIAFARENGRVTQLTVADPNLMVTAQRLNA